MLNKDKSFENTKNAENTCGLNLNKEFDTVILLVRHGESLGNARREFLGHTDKDLSELGYKQADATADYISEVKIDAVYSSDLIRAYNTALPHARMRNIDVIKSTELREVYAGEWEGKSVAYIIENYPFHYYDEWRGNFGECILPAGESIPNLASRIYNEVLRIAKDNLGKTVLIGCHAAAIRSFWGKIMKMPPELLATEIQFPTNASISVVYYNGVDLIPGEYSHDKHILSLVE